ncbi:hypothetical protein BIW11_09462 [Tropilaelaps mercedesae]|uniref:Uncharacterized protein n=1 Tax=Tropilaelaps mercedesae TaxID=418985 RepID=A0A1V9XK86_9ACAR|nr:hypothetical protein BIW11_09462 [Tropilaelaps mercedesae]
MTASECGQVLIGSDNPRHLFCSSVFENRRNRPLQRQRTLLESKQYRQKSLAQATSSPGETGAAPWRLRR